MTKISYTKLQKKYGGMYVLMDKPDGKVVAASRNLGKAFKEAEKKGFKTPAVQFVPPYGVITMYKEAMVGYEGTTVLAYRSQIKLHIDNRIFKIPCVFNPNEEVPILLGRAGILDKFNILLDGKNNQAIFEEI